MRNEFADHTVYMSRTFEPGLDTSSLPFDSSFNHRSNNFHMGDVSVTEYFGFYLIQSLSCNWSLGVHKRPPCLQIDVQRRYFFSSFTASLVQRRNDTSSMLERLHGGLSR
jgi:hypothetical protein